MTFVRAISLILVFCLGSTFTLACAFACADPAVPAVSSHCHQAEPDHTSAPTNGPALQKTSVTCPMLSELNSRPASLSAASLKVLVLPQALLPLETSLLAEAEPKIYPTIPPEPLGSLPLYLRKRVLRI